MKLEYLYELSDKWSFFKRLPSVNLIRLYNFTPKEAKKLIDIIKSQILDKQLESNLTAVDFIEPINCSLILQISTTDEGILKIDKQNNFVCRLSLYSYETMTLIMEPFTKPNATGDNLLYNMTTSDIDFLFSVDGQW